MKRNRLLTITSLALVLGLTVATGAGSTYTPQAEEKEVTKYTYPMEIYSITGNRNFANSRINFIHIYDKLKGNDNFANATIGDPPQGGYDMWFGGIEGDRNFTNMTEDPECTYLMDMYVKNDLIGDDNFDGTILQKFYLRIGGTLKGRFGKVEVKDPALERYPVPYIRAGVLEDVDFSKLTKADIVVDKKVTGNCDYLFANKDYVSVDLVSSYFDYKTTPTPVTISGKHLFKGCKEVVVNMYYTLNENYSKYNTIIDDPYLFEDLAECEKVTIYRNCNKKATGGGMYGDETTADKNAAENSEYIKKLIAAGATVSRLGSDGV